MRRREYPAAWLTPGADAAGAPARYIEYNSLHRIQLTTTNTTLSRDYRERRSSVAVEQISGPASIVCIPRKASESALSGNHKRALIFLGDIQMLSLFRRLMKNEHGATAIEYTLIAALVAIAAVTALTTVGRKISTVMSNVAV